MFMHRTRLLWLPLFWMMACGGETSSSPCTPNQQLACACPGSSVTGVQVCDASGQSFSACTGCDLASAGQGGAGPAGGSGGSAPGGGAQGGSSAQGGNGTQGGSAPGGAAGISGTSGQGGSAPAGQGGSSAGGQGGSAQGGAGAQGEGGAGCSGYAVTLTQQRAQVLVVLDRSGSMEEGGKWGAIVQGLSTVFDEASDALGVGLLRFPEGSPSSCSTFDVMCQTNFECTDIKEVPNVPVAALAQTRGPLKALLTTTIPNGGTPTRWALHQAYTYLSGVQVPGDRYVLLVTDGVPSFTTGNLQQDCGTEADLMKEASTAYQQSPSVRTLAIGVPGSEGAQSILSGVAQNGGGCRPGGSPQTQSCHYQLGTANLAASLATIGAQVLAPLHCRFRLDSPFSLPPDDFTVLFRLTVDGSPVLVPQGGPDGWSFVAEDPQTVQLSGSACALVNGGTTAQAQLEANCP